MGLPFLIQPRIYLACFYIATSPQFVLQGFLLVVLLLVRFPMSSLTKKEKRAYQRLASGLSIGGHKDSYFRFMTLTSAPDSPDINKSFNLLKHWIARATPKKIRKLNKKYHINLPTFEGFKFNKYFKLKTAEGHNVLHIVYWGAKQHFIPQAWLQWVWDHIHGAFKADIRIVWRRHRTRKARINGLVGYLLTNYLTKQPILRMSYGWKWAWLGFCKSWNHVKKEMSLLRKSADMSQPSWIQIGGRNIMRWTGKQRRRNCTLEYWRSLMKTPLPTSRQLKWCTPDHSRYNSAMFDILAF